MSDTPPFYKYHVFFCTNKRADGRQSCGDFNAEALRAYAKDKVKQAGLAVAGGVRINSAGCMNRCDQGPVIVIYPDAVWYTYVDQEDIDEIVERHLINGQVVERLLIDRNSG